MKLKRAILSVSLVVALFVSTASFVYAANDGSPQATVEQAKNNGNNDTGNSSGHNGGGGATNQGDHSNNGGCNNDGSNNNGGGNNAGCDNTGGYADGGNIPEVPYAAVLPLGLLGIMWLVYRRRAQA